MSHPDCADVARKAHELMGRYGAFNAALHAERISQEALTEGNADEHAFWKAVARSLAPR
jgi:hypothetical protein